MSRKTYLPFAALASIVVATGLYGTVAAVGQPAPPLPPPPAMQDAGPVRFEGEVREIFGNKVIVEGPSGRVLVETGPEGRLRAALAPGDRITIDGVQRDGFIHAAGVTKAGGTRIALGPVPGPDVGPGGRMGPDGRMGPGGRGGPGGPEGRVGPGGPPDRFGPPRGAGIGYRQDVVLDAVAKAGFKDAQVADVKPRHAEVTATGADGRSYELHVEFDGRIRNQEDITLIRDEGAIKALIEKAGYSYAGQMRPEKKHMVVTATNSRGEKVELDVHRDGTIRQERRVF